MNDASPDISIMLLPGDDEGDGMQVVAFDDDQPICTETLIDLVARCVDLECVDGELHPYVDSTLNLLSDMTYAMLKTVERMEHDDPHRQYLHQTYAEAYAYVQHIVDRMIADDASVPKPGTE
jgi:hypothetical protein